MGSHMISKESFARLKRLYSVVPILLLGEPGVGKTHTARALWEANGCPGGRTGGFVHVNCAAISPELIDSELFGHVRGAFTGAASSRQGLVRAAGVGCLFLDEVGELPTHTQGRLLRLLSERELRPVGDDKSHSVRCSVIAATNRDLKADMRAGRFRADLFSRFGEVATIPPLRESAGEMDALVLDRGAFLDAGGRALVKRQPWRDTNVRGLLQFLTKLERLGARTEADVARELDLLPAVAIQGPYDATVAEAARRLTAEHGDAEGWWPMSELASLVGASVVWTRKRLAAVPGVETDGSGRGKVYRLK